MIQAARLKGRNLSFLSLGLATALLSGACAQAPGDGAIDSDMRFGTRVHKMPMRNSPTNTSAPAGAHLTYFGGRVVSNMQVVQVLWGAGSYLPQVQRTSSPSMATFYQGILNSPYTDMFTEYNTPASGGTNQQIGRGSFLSQVTITPSASNNGTTIADSGIQTELAAQINAGNLPAPTHDAAGNNNTYYAIFFPHGKSITQGGSASCVQFCAYHGTVANVPGHGEIFYGAHPDMQAGSGCESGCGSSATPFNNYTSVASHEMSETITDCEVGIATANAAPLAWYDTVNGENGDICNAQQGPMTGSDGVSYTVQAEFSNLANDCIYSRGTTTPPNDFSISAGPASVSVVAGSAGSSSISTATLTGSAQTVSFSGSGQPSGVSLAFSPTSVSSGSSSTLTISTTASAVAGSYSISVKGTGASATHSTTVSLTITSSGGGGGGGFTNGGFESGTAGWTFSGTTSIATSGCHGGTSCAQLGSSSATNGDSSAVQSFTAPSNATGISLWYKETCPDTVTYDWALATLADTTTGTTATLVTKACSTTAWVNATGTLTAGHNYTLTLTSHDDNYSADPTFTIYDDVTLTSSGGGGGGGITNGGFESGKTAWTFSGTSSIATSGCHGGTSCAQLGTTTPTSGDSSAAQTFTAPAGTSKLSFWYSNSCPDSVTYDWATVTLKDNTSGTTSTPLAKTCTAQGWKNATATVTAGHSYTLTLSSHDDNYASDPTFTLYDDVTVN